MPQELIIALALSIVMGLSLVIIFKPIKTEQFFLSRNNNIDPMISKLVDVFGGDILAFFSNDYINDKEKLRTIEKNIRRSANPWNITPHEYLILRIVTRVLGVIMSIIAFFIFSQISFLGLPPVVFGLLVATLIFFLMFIYVDNTHTAIANSREKEFLVELPEAIDYLVMAISGGGYTLSSAFAEVIHYMKPSVVKDEFILIVSDLKAGKTLAAALDSFAYRAPSESVKSFSKALSNANTLSVSTVDILRARSKASRLDLNNEINKKITVLPNKVNMWLSPSALLSLMMVVGAPAIFQLIAA